MRLASNITRLVVLCALALVLAACSGPAAPAAPALRSDAAGYDSLVQGLHPYAYYHVAGAGHSEPDLVGRHPGRWTGVPAHVALPDGTRVADFRVGDFVTIASARGFSIPTTGRFSVIAWMRPDTLNFAAEEGAGYVHWLGKGASGEQEWVLRMYSQTNGQNRPNRISSYVFNPGGGEGSGAYVQDPVRVHRWMMIGFEVSTAPAPGFPTGWVAIFKDGRERSKVGLDQFGVTPRAGRAPVRIGTRDLESFFQGAIGDVAFFDRLVPEKDMGRLYAIMTRASGTQG